MSVNIQDIRQWYEERQALAQAVVEACGQALTGLRDLVASERALHDLPQKPERRKKLERRKKRRTAGERRHPASPPAPALELPPPGKETGGRQGRYADALVSYLERHETHAANRSELARNVALICKVDPKKEGTFNTDLSNAIAKLKASKRILRAGSLWVLASTDGSN